MNNIRERLKLLAATVWYIGVVALGLKSFSLLTEAYRIDSNLLSVVLLVLVSLLVSLVKTKYIFAPSCQRNLTRIKSLEHPKIWQFYRAGFFLFLVVVISFGAYLSRAAEGNYWFLMGVGGIDLALALALFFGGFVFWQRGD